MTFTRPFALTLAAAVLAGMAWAAQEDVFSFIPHGGRTLLAQALANKPATGDVQAMLAAKHSREEWAAYLKGHATQWPTLGKLSDKELKTLADYMYFNMPLAAKAPSSPSQANWEKALPLDGRDMALDYCQGCHIITVVVTQDRTKEAWLGTMNKPSHVQIKLSKTQREALAEYLVRNAAIPIEQVPEDGNGSYNLKPEAQATMKAAPTAGPEVVGGAGEVLPVPGGGWVLADNQGGHWTMQRFDANGAPVSSTSITVSNPYFTWFAALSGGGYAATWIENTATAGVSNVLTQAFSASGAPLGSAITIAQVEPGRLAHPPALPQIAALTGGGYVVAWGLPVGNNGVYAERFTATGAPAASAVQVTPSGTGSLAATGLPTGGYVVTWGQFAATGGVQAFSATDTPVGTTQAAGDNGDGGGPPMPVMASLTGGGAVIAWQAVHEHVYVQQVAADGTPVTAAQVVDDQSTTLVFAQISIGALPDGGYVIAWAENGDVYARRYLASGVPAGPQTKINLVSTSAGGPTGVAVHADGSFEVHWNALGTDGVRHWYSRTFPAGSL